VLLAAPACSRSRPEADHLVFPVRGDFTLVGRFGEARANGRRHLGVDIAADKMTPVVAVAAGTIEWLHDTPGDRCCAVALHHDNGWYSRYLHLNDDTPGTDDGRVVGIVKGLQVGDQVRAGQLIGWVGDSGNATAPHLHFELHQPDGTAVDPYQSLQAAIGREGDHIELPRNPEGLKWRLALIVALVAATLTIRICSGRPGEQGG
jgi:murein DD-endopeptidase MepM/ murein hydrolase activator NlpD